ncbi:MAG TPA: biopolymer transporter ExbD [Planctomycetaceae bacterium]|nr:biopolymer transporter ExbD [Planctomycetaceae bacterium]
MKIKSDKPELPEPDMTPMIDCVFQLITFFMVVINFENTQADERVKLPDSALAKPPKVKIEDELVLNIGYIRDKTGKNLSEPLVFWPGVDVPVKEIEPYLVKEKQFWKLKHPGTSRMSSTVTIRADGDVPTGVVQELIQSCQTQGFEKFVLKAMEPEAQ